MKNFIGKTMEPVGVLSHILMEAQTIGVLRGMLKMLQNLKKKANYAKGVEKRKKTLKKKAFRKGLRNSAIRIGVLTGGFVAADSYLNRRKRKGSGRKPKNK